MKKIINLIKGWTNGENIKNFKGKSVKGKIFSIIYTISAVTLIVSLSMLASKGIETYKNKKLYENLFADTGFSRDDYSTPEPIVQQTEEPDVAINTSLPDETALPIATDTPEATEPIENETHEPSETPPPRGMYASLLEINEDVVGYIEIPGTRLKYPVLQDDDNAFYIDHDINGNKADHGSIFMDYHNNPVDLYQNTLIHGHHMQDGTMFQLVEQYKREWMSESHPVVYFDTLYENYEWEFFSVYVTNENELIPLTFASDDEFVQYCNEVRDRSSIHVDVEFSKDDVLLTLITCSYEFSGARTVVTFRMVERSGERWTKDYDWKSTTERVLSK